MPTSRAHSFALASVIVSTRFVFSFGPRAAAFNATSGQPSMTRFLEANRSLERF
jgi:hypothetical protein